MAARGELLGLIADYRRLKHERGFTEFTTTFIGAKGILAVSTDTAAVYRFKGGEGFVRAKVVDSNGRVAWPQPVWP